MLYVMLCTFWYNLYNLFGTINTLFKLYKWYLIAQSVLYTECGHPKELWHIWAELFLQDFQYIFGCNNSISVDAANQNGWYRCELNRAYQMHQVSLPFIAFFLDFKICAASSSNWSSWGIFIVLKTFFLWWSYFIFVVWNTKFFQLFDFSRIFIIFNTIVLTEYLRWCHFLWALLVKKIGRG